MLAIVKFIQQIKPMLCELSSFESHALNNAISKIALHILRKFHCTIRLTFYMCKSTELPSGTVTSLHHVIALCTFVYLNNKKKLHFPTLLCPLYFCKFKQQKIITYPFPTLHQQTTHFTFANLNSKNHLHFPYFIYNSLHFILLKI